MFEVNGEALNFERDYALPRVIVWDALVDSGLVSGWFGEAMIAPEVGGEYNLRWGTQAESLGRITELRPFERLVLETTGLGRLAFELAEFPGGSRDTSTHIRLTVEDQADPGAKSSLVADWLTRLDQLEELLRGHPVDWANWERDWRETWSRYRAEAEEAPG